MLNKTFSLSYQGSGGATDLWTLADEDNGQQIQVAPMTVANTSTDLIGWELPADPINL